MTDEPNLTPDPDDDHDPQQEMIEQYSEIFRAKADELEAAGRKVGLYIRDAGLTMIPMPHGAPDMEINPAMVVNFTVGDQAWSDRIQNPEQDSTETEFRKMAVEMEKDKFEETRADLERRLREGKNILGGDEEQ